MTRLKAAIDRIEAGDYETAAAELGLLQREQEFRSAALGHRAWLFLSLGRFEESLADLEKLSECGPGNLHARCVKAELLLKLGRVERSATEAALVLSEEPLNDHALGVLIECRRAGGLDNLYPPNVVRTSKTTPAKVTDDAKLVASGFQRTKSLINKLRFPCRYDYYEDYIRRHPPGPAASGHRGHVARQRPLLLLR